MAPGHHVPRLDQDLVAIFLQLPRRSPCLASRVERLHTPPAVSGLPAAFRAEPVPPGEHRPPCAGPYHHMNGTAGSRAVRATPGKGPRRLSSRSSAHAQVPMAEEPSGMISTIHHNMWYPPYNMSSIVARGGKPATAYIAPFGKFGVWRFLIKSGAGDAGDKRYPLLRERGRACERFYAPCCCTQARWAGRGSVGQRRAVGACRVSGMRSTVEAGGAEPDNARRSGPGDCDTLHGDRRSWRDADGLAVVLADAAAGYGRGPQAAGHRGRRARQSPRRRLASEGRGDSCRPATARPRLNPGRPRRVTPAALPSRLLAPVLAVHGRGRQARRAGGAPLNVKRTLPDARASKPR